MAEPEESDAPEKKKGRKKPMLIGLLLALLLGGGGFYAARTGLILGDSASTRTASNGPGGAPLPDVAFVPLDPLVISLGNGGQTKFLRFTAELEVGAGQTADVTRLKPRVLDALNGYLRAVDIKELEDPRSLFRLRAQMLRRIQVITGQGRVRDLLVTEFVLK